MKKCFLMAFALISGLHGCVDYYPDLTQKITNEINQLGALADVMKDGHSIKSDWINLQNRKGGQKDSSGKMSGDYLYFYNIQNATKVFGVKLSEESQLELKKDICLWVAANFIGSSNIIVPRNLVKIVKKKINNFGHSPAAKRMKRDWISLQNKAGGRGFSTGETEGNYQAYNNILNASKVFGLNLTQDLQQYISLWLAMNYTIGCENVLDDSPGVVHSYMECVLTPIYTGVDLFEWLFLNQTKRKIT